MKQKGQGLVEYGLILLLIIIVVMLNVLKIQPAGSIAGGILAGIASAIIISGIIVFVFGLEIRITGIITFLILLIVGSFLWSRFFLNKAAFAQLNQTTDTILLAGKVVDPTTGDWHNNRLVLIFEREKEIHRTISYRGEIPENGLGVIDGLFVVEIPNTYKFSVADFRVNQVPFDFQITTRPNGLVSKRKVIYTWFPEFPEGEKVNIIMTSKNLRYTIFVLNGDIANLPPEIVGETTEFRTGRLIVVPKQTAPDEVSQTLGGDFILQNVVYNVSLDQIPLKKITVSVDNCKNDLEIHTPYSYSQTYIHKYTREDTKGGSLQFSVPYLTWAKIGLEIQSKYGFEENQVDNSTITYDLFAAPHSYQSYTVAWTEIWENGVANVVKDNQPVSVPFRVQTNLIYEITSETRSCP